MSSFGRRQWQIERFVCKTSHQIPYGQWPENELVWATDALTFARQTKTDWLRMPLYPVTEARLLGAVVQESEYGAWCDAELQPFCQKPLPPVIEEAGALRLLSALTMLADSQQPVIMEVQGTLTVAEALLGTSRMYRYLRNDEPYLSALTDTLSDWALRCLDAGASLLSFADPLASLDLLGEKNFTRHYLPLLRQYWDRIFRQRPDVPVICCGKLSQGLQDCGVVTLDILPLPRPMSLPQALRGQKGGVFAQECINNAQRLRQQLYRLHWAE